MSIQEHGIDVPDYPTKKTSFFTCGGENILPDLAGYTILLLLGLDVLSNNTSRSQLFMTAAAMIHASCVDPAFDNEYFVGVTQTPDGIRPEFMYGTRASPLSIYKADQLTGWPVCYYSIMLVPLELEDVHVHREFKFSVGLFVTPKDGIVLASAGTPNHGFGVLSLLRAHEAPKANLYVDPKAMGSQPHLRHADIERWLTKITDLTDKESTSVHREQVIRDALAIGKRIKYSRAFPHYRIVTTRVIVNIV